jgi:DNA-binding HxlR family transcriptional regulator
VEPFVEGAAIGAETRSEQVDRSTWDLSTFHGEWKLKTLTEISQGSLRVGDLFAGATERMLIDSLRALEADGIIERTELQGAARHVEYALVHVFRKPMIDLIE